MLYGRNDSAALQIDFGSRKQSRDWDFQDLVPSKPLRQLCDTHEFFRVKVMSWVACFYTAPQCCSDTPASKYVPRENLTYTYMSVVMSSQVKWLGELVFAELAGAVDTKVRRLVIRILPTYSENLVVR
jgi:hypothetical protein